MPRLSGIKYRKLIGLMPKSRLSKEQTNFIDQHSIKPDLVEYYFGRRCEYWKIDNLKVSHTKTP